MVITTAVIVTVRALQLMLVNDQDKSCSNPSASGMTRIENMEKQDIEPPDPTRLPGNRQFVVGCEINFDGDRCSNTFCLY